jgi:hypothetical protein
MDTAVKVKKVAELLHEAAECHHHVYRLSDGEDPDWASWYADWLTAHTELPEIIGRPVVRSELTWMLVGLDKEYAHRGDVPGERWTDYYAGELLRHFSR